MQFAERYPTDEALSNALDNAPTWRDVIRTLPKDRRLSVIRLVRCSIILTSR
jgi:hypothetical protein